MSEFQPAEDDHILPIDDEPTGYEVITSDEVDRVVTALEELMERVQSENIRSILDAAADEIYCLVYSTDTATEAEAA